jgi:hypothetical protein
MFSNLPRISSWATLKRPFGTPVVFFRNLLEGEAYFHPREQGGDGQH